MECNKDEAFRAKEIAERKMETKDFLGARRVLLKAQQLYPALDNVSQMLAVCEVHYSAEQKVNGSEMDWYGILQVESTADEVSIKRQYRKLALVLHPDKNKFAGAEAAFKLIGEANRVLSDQMKRSVYDIKFRAYRGTTVPKQPPNPPSNRPFSKQPVVQQQNQSRPSSKQPGVQSTFVNSNPQFTMSSVQPQQQQQQQQHSGPGVQNTFVNGINPLFTRYMYHPQQQHQSGPGIPAVRQTFWTMCPFCSMKYQYYTDVVSRVLRCQSCKQPYIAHSVDPQGGPQAPNHDESTFPQQNVFPAQADPRVGPQTASVNPFHSMGSQRNGNGGTTAPQAFPKMQSNPSSGVGSKLKRKEDGRGDMGVGKKAEKVAKCTAEMSRERKPSEKTNTGMQPPRRSPRKQPSVTDNEDAGNHDGYVDPVKRARTESSKATEEQSTKASSEAEASKTNKQEGRIHPQRSFPNGNDGGEKFKTNGAESPVSNNSKSGQCPDEIKPEPEFFEVPDPDFNDFDIGRTEDCFAVDQIWAIYDTSDSMPRFYARIRKVNTPGFKLRITWLEADSNKQDEIDWYDEDLPVACGKFKLGNTENTEDRFMFSHLIPWEKGTSRGSYMIYPRKGETWALFKNWDISWKSDPDNHRQYDLEFVEVLSDYAENQGIQVVYLVKVRGFVSLFKQASKKGVVPANELLRFSHNIPSFRMTGKERCDVPEGSFEFDPAAFPANIEASSNQANQEEKVQGVDSELKGSHSETKTKEAESLKEAVAPSMPNTTKNLDEKITQKLETLKIRKGFPVESNGNHEKRSPSENVSHCAFKEEINKGSHSLKDTSHGGSNPGGASMFQADVEKSTPDSSRDQTNPSAASSSESGEIAETIFFDFEVNRTQEIFQASQVWALYSDEDGFPKYYARINRVQSSPKFKLHVTWLEACPTSKDMLQWSEEDMPVSCGVFRPMATNGGSTYTNVSPFSHQVKTDFLGRHKYEIHPRTGEIWALYKNFNVNWTGSQLAKCEYDMVEVIEVDQSAISVLVLERVDDFKTIFRARGEPNNTMKISQVELLRFSHQIPAFRLTDEKDGILRGCWELDPAAFPVD